MYIGKEGKPPRRSLIFYTIITGCDDDVAKGKGGRQKEFVDTATKQYDTIILFNSVSNNMSYIIRLRFRYYQTVKCCNS